MDLGGDAKTHQNYYRRVPRAKRHVKTLPTQRSAKPQEESQLERPLQISVASKARTRKFQPQGLRAGIFCSRSPP